MVISASANFHLAGTWLGPAGPGYLDKMPQRKHSAWLPSTSRVDAGYVLYPATREQMHDLADLQ